MRVGFGESNLVPNLPHSFAQNGLCRGVYPLQCTRGVKVDKLLFLRCFNDDFDLDGGQKMVDGHVGGQTNIT